MSIARLDPKTPLRRAEAEKLHFYYRNKTFIKFHST